ncbi:MAG: methionine synthase, partial [Actinomycetota bacterium]
LREVYDGRVFYGRDAFEGLHTLEKLMEMKRNGVDDPEFGRVPTGRSLAERRAPKDAPTDLPRRSPEAVTDNKVFTPPFVGSRVVKGLSLDEIAEYVNETALFRNQWQYRPLDGENDDDFKTRIRPELRAQLAQAKASGILVPQL